MLLTAGLLEAFVSAARGWVRQVAVGGGRRDDRGQLRTVPVIDSHCMGIAGTGSVCGIGRVVSI